MARYVDGFLLPVPRRKSRRIARFRAKAGKIWREHGALEYRECAGDDLKVKMGRAFPRKAKAKPEKRWCSPGSCTSRARIAIESIAK